MFRNLLFFIFFLIPSISFALSEKSFWGGVIGKTALDDKAFLWNEFQLRYGLDLGQTKQSVFRTGPLYKLSETHEIGLLYGFIVAGNTKEHRYTQQLQSRWTSELTSRLRLEQRELEGRDQWHLRTRLLMRWQKALSEKVSLLVWDEVFLYLNKARWTHDETYDRNRFFLGVRNKLYSKLEGEFGYLHQHVNEKVDQNEHVLAAYFYF